MPSVIINHETSSFRETPEEKERLYNELSENGKKIAMALDQHLNEDILFFKDGNVLIRLRLGNKIIAEYPIHCEIENDEVVIYEYANSKSDQRREE